MHSTIQILGTLFLMTALCSDMLVGPVAASARPTPAAAEKTSPGGARGESALALVAEREQRASRDLELIDSQTAAFPLLGVTVSGFKVMDRVTGEIFTTALDAQGDEVDLEALLKDEAVAHEARFGRLDPALAERLETLRADESLDVAIWLAEPSAAPVRPGLPGMREPQPTAAEVAGILAEIDRARGKQLEGLAGPVLQKLAEQGIEARFDGLSPVIRARVAPDAVRMIGGWNEVDRIYGQDGKFVPMLEATRSTVYANTVNNYPRLQMGLGVQVAQIEIGGRVLPTNPWLSGVIQDATNVCPTATLHSTFVAGIIRSSNTPQRGIAPGVTLRSGGSCTGWASELESAATRAANSGAQVLNASYGWEPPPFSFPCTSLPYCLTYHVDSHARFYDDMVRNRARTVVAAAGNNDVWGGTHVTSPGTAFNVITVGNVNDWKTGSWDYPLADAMAPNSSYTNPYSRYGDREKPELVAPGTMMTSTTHSWPFVGQVDASMDQNADGRPDSGTSFSAAVVSGAAALVIGRAPALGIWPEAVKAILMATAVHNIEGAARLSDKDGAGAIVLTRADDVARQVAGGWSGQGYTCDASTRGTTSNLTTVTLAAGQRLRAVIAWDNDPAYGIYYNSNPGHDLDLQLVDASGVVRAFSASRDNTYEIIDTTVASAGSFTLRVVRTHCYMHNVGFLGFAFHTP